ncbi:MAG: hypothetical protein JO170_30950 [Verrucomicrobia bacterium]|nr:hypothetical protein [Verrucomicrobiota bacterium]
MTERTDRFLARVRAWCDKEHGRRARLARFMEVPKQTVTDVLNGRQLPTGEQVLAMQEYLSQQGE